MSLIFDKHYEGQNRMTALDASIIQAIAAVCNIIVTGGLLWLTARSVKLTDNLAKASSQQAALLARQTELVERSTLETRRRKAALLQGLCRRIRVATAHLDSTNVTAKVSKNFTYLSAGDAELISTLAADTSVEAAEASGLVTLAVRNVVNLLNQVQSESSWSPSTQEASDWNGALSTIATDIPKIELACRAVLSERFELGT